MIALSLDNALHVSGYCVWQDENIKKIGTFETKSNAPIEQRLGSIWKYLNDLYSEHSFEYIFFEDCQKQQNMQTYQKLSMVKATILLWCYFNNVQYSVLSPSHWRSVIKEKYGFSFGTKREEQKQNSIKFVKEKFRKKATEDEADSIALGCAALIEKKRNKGAF